ncbi:MAG: hypothetical protein M3O70_27695 [Actinomycetota bacterium]|nr:hypothetical protein [Actinomycetota bacterium]
MPRALLEEPKEEVWDAHREALHTLYIVQSICSPTEHPLLALALVALLGIRGSDPTLDQRERRRRAPNVDVSSEGNNAVGALMTQIGQQAGTTDPPHPRCQPPLPFMLGNWTTR